MNNPYTKYGPITFRTNSQTRTPPKEQLRSNNAQKAIQEVRYHQPFERLERRSKFTKIIKEQFIHNAQLLKHDNFALYDAVAKRGGYRQVCTNERWEEINFCLYYQKKHWNVSKYYMEVLLPHESKLMEILQWYQPDQTFEQQVLELHLLPSNNLTSSYYQLVPSEYMFAESNFFSMDEYFNLKTICLLQPQISKVPVQFADKFMILRKRLIFTNQIKHSSVKQLNTLCITANTQNKVILIGISLSSFLIADKLSELGISVILIDKNKKQAKYREDNQIVQNGVILLQGGKQQGSYYSNLVTMGITTEQCNNYSVILDQEGKIIPDEKVRIVEEHFMGLINELREEIMNKKKFYEELMSRVLRRRLEHEKPLIKWHYDRYMLLNRIRGENTTVGDLVSYESKKFVKHVVQSNSLLVFRSLNKFYEKIKTKNNVTFCSSNIESTAYINGMWNVKTKNQTVVGKYLIYSDQESVYKSVLEGNPRLADIGSDIMGDAVSILQQLTALKYVNCLYCFKDKVAFRQGMSGLTSFTINSIHGYIYYFVLNGGQQILAILRCYSNTIMNYYLQLFSILQNKCLVKGNKLVGQQNYAFQYSFSLKDEKYMESLIKIKQNQKMYLMLPITTVNFPHRIQSQVDMANYICSLILEDKYPEYTLYDKEVRKMFLQEPSGRTQKIVTQPQNAQNCLEIAEPNNQIMLQTVKSSQNNQKIQLIKVNSTERESKTRVINQNNMDIEIQEPQILKNFSLPSHLFEADSFGLRSALVKNYQLFIQQKIQKNQRWKQSIISACQFSLDRQIIIAENLHLVSLGQPYLKSNDWFNCILQKTEQKQWIFPLHKFISRREHISLDCYWKPTVYYQTVLVINEEVYYCIADEDDPQQLYYHTNYQTLIKMMNEVFSVLKNEQQKEGSHLNRPKLSSNPPKILTSSHLIQKISKQLSRVEKPVDFDNLLKAKLSQVYPSKRQKFMIGNFEHSIHSNGQLKVDRLLNDIETNTSIVLKQINAYMSTLFKAAELKQFSFFQVFFGVLNEQYICCQIMKKFDLKPVSYQELQILDGPLCQQIKEVFSRSTANNLFSIYIVPQFGSITAHRNFKHRIRPNDFQQYTYIYSFAGKQQEHYLVMGQQKIKFQDKTEIMTYLVRNLVINHHNFDIINSAQQLLHLEIEKEKYLSPRLKTYYIMTKKEIIRINPTSVAKFQERCKQFNQQEKEMTVDLMRKNKMKWVQNDFVFVLK